MHRNNQESKKIQIIGWGSQAKAWALNLRDSGMEISIALRNKSKSIELAKEKGFKVNIIGNKKDKSKQDLNCLLIPDNQHAVFLKKHISWIEDCPNLVYAHGFSLVKEDLNIRFPKINHMLLAPKAIASELRWQYENKGKLGAAFCTQYSKNPVQSEKEILALAKNLGITAGPFRTSFKDEMVADLFSEQSLLCSFMPFAMQHSFNRLVAKGISKEIAYLECWFEIKLIADTLVPLGPLKFFELISPNALIGGNKAQKILFDEAYQKKLDNLLEDIIKGSFLKEADATSDQELREELVEKWSCSLLNKTQLYGEK